MHCDLQGLRLRRLFLFMLFNSYLFFWVFFGQSSQDIDNFCNYYANPSLSELCVERCSNTNGALPYCQGVCSGMFSAMSNAMNRGTDARFEMVVILPDYCYTYCPNVNHGWCTQTCTGTNEANPTIRESVTYSSVSGTNTETDRCVQLVHPFSRYVAYNALVEYYCQGNQMRISINYCNRTNGNMQEACSDGICQYVSNTICTDTDFGDNPYLSGSVTVTDGSSVTTFTDSCENNHVVEWRCEYSGQNYQASNRNYDCVNGCVNGACRNSGCSKGGRVTVNKNEFRVDYCVDLFTLRNYSCNEENIVFQDVDCRSVVPAGYCWNGECMGTTCFAFGEGYGRNAQMVDVRGSVTVNSRNIADSCIDAYTLNETYCNIPVDATVSWFSQQCPNNQRCENGQCVQSTCGNNQCDIPGDFDNGCARECCGNEICDHEAERDPYYGCPADCHRASVTSNQIVVIAQNFAPCFSIILFTVFFVLVVMYMLSKAVSNQKLEAFVRNEFVEMGKALFHLFLLFGLMGLANVQGANIGDLVDQARIFLDRYNDAARNVYEVLAINYGRMVKIFAFDFNYSFQRNYLYAAMEGLAPFAGYMAFAQGTLRLADTLFHLVVLNSLIKLVLIFLNASLPLLLVGTFLLRIIPVTRNAGIFIMGFVISIYFILPLGIIVYQYLGNDLIERIGDNFSEQNRVRFLVPDKGKPPDVGLYCQPWIQMFTFIGEERWASIICPPFQPLIPYPLCKFLVMIFYISVHHGFTRMASGALMNYITIPEQELMNQYVAKSLLIMDFVSQMFVVTIVSYLFILVIMLIIAKSVANALGADVHFYGFSKFI